MSVSPPTERAPRLGGSRLGSGDPTGVTVHCWRCWAWLQSFGLPRLRLDYGVWTSDGKTDPLCWNCGAEQDWPAFQVAQPELLRLVREAADNGAESEAAEVQAWFETRPEDWEKWWRS